MIFMKRIIIGLIILTLVVFLFFNYSSVSTDKSVYDKTEIIKVTKLSVGLVDPNCNFAGLYKKYDSSWKGLIYDEVNQCIYFPTEMPIYPVSNCGVYLIPFFKENSFYISGRSCSPYVYGSISDGNLEKISYLTGVYKIKYGNSETQFEIK